MPCHGLRRPAAGGALQFDPPNFDTEPPVPALRAGSDSSASQVGGSNSNALPPAGLRRPRQGTKHAKNVRGGAGQRSNHDTRPLHKNPLKLWSSSIQVEMTVWRGRWWFLEKSVYGTLCALSRKSPRPEPRQNKNHRKKKKIRPQARHNGASKRTVTQKPPASAAIKMKMLKTGQNPW